MKKLLYLATILTMILALAAMSLPAEAAKPQRQVGEEMVYVGNGYPSGPHFNLNFLAKEIDTFVCPTVAEYGSETLDKNVIYVPRGSEHGDIGVLVESGKRGPKNSSDPQVFEVTDWCSEDFDGTEATLNLPPDPNGYMVYARITGKPFDGEANGEISGEGDGFYADLGGCLKYVEDENLANNDLILLGLVSSTGVYVPTCDEDNSPGQQILLQRTGSNGKGVKKAVPITPIFEWSGRICNIDPLGTDVFCCVDTDVPADGIFEYCVSLSDLGGGSCSDYTPPSEINGVTGSWTYSPVTASCTIYDDPTWVFNIADFVNYMWDIDSNGAYNIKVRFYPCSQQPLGICPETGN